MNTSQPLPNNFILANRYRLIQCFGKGGFGQIYLSEDIQNSNRICVVKEFAPNVQNDQQFDKAKELFKREADTLAKLKHPQIPQCYDFFDSHINGQNILFLVQEYIKGQSYQNLLLQKKQFSEAEVTQLLLDTLPILDYIHGLNLIHRDISPDNLIQRHSDGKPVLIDFGCVKLAVNQISRLIGVNPTLIGKPGYAPEEQFATGKIDPTSDLYALAVTAIVLLTGKQPKDLYDSYNSTWTWQNQVNITPKLSNILIRMLAHNPSYRYQSVREVQQALTSNNPSVFSQISSTIATLVVAPSRSFLKRNNPNNLVSNLTTTLSLLKTQFVGNSGKPATVTQPPKPIISNPKLWQNLKLILIWSSLIILPGFIVFNLFKVIINKPWIETDISQEEKTRQDEIAKRINQLKNPGVFNQEVDRIFYERNPHLKGYKLTSDPKDAKLRSQWYDIAEELLDKQS